MEEELSLDNILDSDAIDNLFVEDEETQDTPPVDKETSKEEENKEIEETTEVNPDTLFDEPESVGSGKEDNTKDEEDTNSTKDNGTSPKNNFYSSIAKALKEDGVFPDLDDETTDSIKEAEDFAKAIDKQIDARLDERTKRVENALNAGMEPSEIRAYENTINYLDSLNDDDLNDEGDKGETLRRKIIYQDYINKGFSKERATKAVNRSFDTGNDIEDAKEALKGNKEFFKNQYDNLIKEGQEEEKREEEERKEQAEKLKKSILEDNKVFGEVEVDKSTRQKVYDNISKPIYKDSEGNYYTAIQKYEMENKTDFLKNVGLLFTLTNGFKDLDGLVKGKVKKEMKRGLRELEHTLNNTARTSDGNLKFASGVEDDTESFIGHGWDLDV